MIRLKSFEWIALATAIAIILITKVPTLGLPHFWDEAFPYSYAIGYMTENGPSILTDAAPSIYTTGHPLLFYFLQATWNAVIGESLILQRLFPLTISLLAMLVTYFLGKAYHGRKAGAAAALLLSCQSAFLAQATFQLPEMLLTALLLSTLLFYNRDYKLAFVVSATALLFVKESGVILLATLGLYHLLVKRKSLPGFKLAKSTWIFGVPAALNLAFYVHQYSVQGWLLFPRHTGFIDFSSDFFLGQFKGYFMHLFIHSGRNGMFFTALILLLGFIWIKRKEIRLSRYGQNAILLSTIITSFITFSAFNFYSNRYILCLFPLFSLLTASAVYFFAQVTHKAILPVGVAILSSVTLFYSYTNRIPHDHSLGYADAVICQKQAIDYCVKQRWQNKSIATGFLMKKYMTSPSPRYLSGAALFKNVHTTITPETQVVLRYDHEQLAPKINLLTKFKTVEKFEIGKISCEVLQRL